MGDHEGMPAAASGGSRERLAEAGASMADAGLEVAVGASIGPFTTYRVGGPAALLVTPASAEEVLAVARVTSRLDLPTLVVGNGSNLLVADAGFDGVVVHLGDELAGIEVEGTVVTAGGAASLPVVARRTVAAGLSGLEWAVGVPGSVGGAVRMNAGGHGSDVAATLRQVRVVDLAAGQDVVMTAPQCSFGYRRSSIRACDVVVEAVFDLEIGDPSAGEEALAEIVRWRRSHQPGGANAGSVFTNPPGDSAGRLIDAAGCKGARIGTAEVSTKHANFIQADPGGSADDIAALMAVVRRRVHESAGVDLVAETAMVGFDAAVVALAGGVRGH